MSFQTCIIFFLQWNVEESILKDVPSFFVHTMKVNGIQINNYDPIDFNCMDIFKKKIQISSFCVLLKKETRGLVNPNRFVIFE